MKKVMLLIAILAVSSGLMSAQTQAPIKKAAPRPAAPAVTKASATKAMTNQDVMDMAAAGLSADVIVRAIKAAKTKEFNVAPAALIELKKAGVPEAAITLMMAPSAEAPEVALTVAAPRTAPVSRAVDTPRNAVGTITIPDGTEVKIRLIETVSSANAKVDQTIRFEAAEDVLVDSKVVIAQGAQASGTITEANHKKSFGRRGQLNFTIDTVKAIDGQNVRLRTAKKVEGDESYVKAGVVTYLAGPFGALVKGKDVVVDAGTTYTIFIDGNRKITLR